MDIISLRRKNLRAAIDAVVNSGRFNSDAAFCEHYDLNPSHISQLVKGHGSFGERAARNLEKKIGWEAGFLDKEISNSEASTTPRIEESNVSFTGKPLRKIPVLDFVQAGLWRGVVYDGIHPIGHTYTDYEGIVPKDVFGVTVDGLSMSPRFMPNDELVIDPNLAPQPGNFVIAQNGDYEVTFKKYRVTGYDEEGREQFQLVPLNPDFGTLDSIQHKISIIGVVVKHIQNLR